MRVEFAKTRHKSMYILTYDDTIGKPEETLAYKNQKLEELVDTLRRNDRAYRTAVNENCLHRFLAALHAAIYNN